MATPPKQARSLATEQKMLDAAEELLSAGDARQVTIEKVIALSGATSGSFYARFGSVEGLFHALHQRYVDSVYQSKLLEALNSGIEQPDLRKALHHIIKTMLEFGYKKRKLLAYFVTRNEGGDALEIRLLAVKNLHAVLKVHRDEVAHNDLRRASENTARLIYQTWVGLILLEPSDFVGRKTSLSSVIDSTTQMAYAYLTTEK
jgi:AcrR family transcriptional regulator